mgnify:CR=1 FL=1
MDNTPDFGLVLRGESSEGVSWWGQSRGTLGEDEGLARSLRILLQLALEDTQPFWFAGRHGSIATWEGSEYVQFGEASRGDVSEPRAKSDVDKTR